MFDNLDDFKKNSKTSLFLSVMENKISESPVLVKKLLKLKNMSNTKI